jgi:hypothetical protein
VQRNEHAVGTIEEGHPARDGLKATAMIDNDDTEPDLTADDMLALAREIQQRVLHLRQTNDAMRRKRRTPFERQALLDRAERVRRRSLLLRRKYTRLLAVH